MSDALTDRVPTSVSGTPQLSQIDAEHGSRGADLLLATPNSSGTQSSRLIDATTGQTRWSIDDVTVSEVSTTQSVVFSNRTISLLDSATGAVLWRYSAKAPAHFVGSVLGTGVVIAIPTHDSSD